MKNLKLSCLLLICFGFQSCKKDIENKEALIEKPIKTECYKAFYEKDTLNLEINTLKDGKIKGTMEMKIFNTLNKTGEISGEFRGDTLFANYTFIDGSNKKITYKNPMAFLKRGNELILGNGKIETSLGASYFAKGTPIDFDRVKYKFTTIDCTNK